MSTLLKKHWIHLLLLVIIVAQHAWFTGRLAEVEDMASANEDQWHEVLESLQILDSRTGGLESRLAGSRPWPH